jgi:hypothetical protein
LRFAHALVALALALSCALRSAFFGARFRHGGNST